MTSTSGRYLLDTNIVIALLANEAVVVEALGKAQDVVVASIVVGELYYGAYNSSRIAENIAGIEEFLAAITVLTCDGVTALHYGIVKSALKQAGTPIPENDVWIAALARQYNRTIVSRDLHLSRIRSVSFETW